MHAVEEALALNAGRSSVLRHPYNLAASVGRHTEAHMPSTSCYFTALYNEPSVRALAYDIGVNQAGDARHLLHAGYRVVSVEADPTKYRRHINDPTLSPYLLSGQWTLLNSALVGKSSGASNITFYINLLKPDSSSTDSRLACRQAPLGKTVHRTCEAVSVSTITCGELVHRFGSGFYLKSDVEGVRLTAQDSLICIFMPAPNKHTRVCRCRSNLAASVCYLKCCSPSSPSFRARRRLFRDSATRPQGARPIAALVSSTICAV